MALSEEAKFQLRRGERMLREREERRERLRAIAHRIARMLQTEFGARRVWLFGSVLRPWFHEESDIDLAAEGVAPERRGEAWDRALELADTAIDVVFLEEAGEALRDRVHTDGEVLV